MDRGCTAFSGCRFDLDGFHRFWCWHRRDRVRGEDAVTDPWSDCCPRGPAVNGGGKDAQAVHPTFVCREKAEFAIVVAVMTVFIGCGSFLFIWVNVRQSCLRTIGSVREYPVGTGNRGE